jgi:hypothetical protein
MSDGEVRRRIEEEATFLNLEAELHGFDDRVTPDMIETTSRNYSRVQNLVKNQDGKFRVLGVDKFSSEDWIEGEYDTAEEAIVVARQKTDEAKKNCFGDNAYSIATVYLAYNPNGGYIGGDTWVKE